MRDSENEILLRLKTRRILFEYICRLWYTVCTVSYILAYVRCQQVTPIQLPMYKGHLSGKIFRISKTRCGLSLHLLLKRMIGVQNILGQERDVACSRVIYLGLSIFWVIIEMSRHIRASAKFGIQRVKIHNPYVRESMNQSFGCDYVHMYICTYVLLCRNLVLGGLN